ncbi:MAG: MarR family transcriptional regulator [Clostridium sp.]|nr:MarR family transcriptional regulator [Clostridium sp.]
MESKKISEQFVQNLLHALPCWHSKLVRPFKDTLNGEMSLETYYCLETLRHCGTVTMTDLARRMKIPKQEITRLIDALAVHEFVERVPNKEDRRMIQLRLTPRAASYLDNYYMKNKAFIQALETQLTEDELHRLNEAVAVLREILPKLG